MFDVHPFFEQPFFQVICLFLHLFPFKIRCWTFSVRCSYFQLLPGKNNLVLMDCVPEGGTYSSEKNTIISAVSLRRIYEPSGLKSPGD